jgi:hypothetical protein
MTPEARRRYEELAGQARALMRNFNGVSLFDLVHSAEMQAALRRAHDLRIELAGEAADGFWTTRNATIVRRCLDAAKDLAARRITSSSEAITNTPSRPSCRSAACCPTHCSATSSLPLCR